MSRKLCFLISFVLVLGMTAVSPAGLDDDPNLAGYWKFDGDTLDSSGNGRHGTLMGDAHLVDIGLRGGALAVDGNGDYVNIDGYKGINADRTDPNNPIQQPFSIACWMKTDSDGEMVTWGTRSGRQKETFRVEGGRLRTEHHSGNLRGNVYVNDNQWHHVALTVVEGANLQPANTKLYTDGVEETYRNGSNNPYELLAGSDVRIGMSGPENGRYFNGMLDEVYIFDRVLDPNEIAELAIRPKSYMADPADGAMVEDVSVLLGWTPGDVAVEHDVYFGTTAELGADQLLGRMATTTALATGLEKDTTHYWRVDDVAADGTVATGDTWSFWVPPRGAYDPDPADGTRILGTTANLSWTGGWTPIMHQVYFGTDPNQVASAEDALQVVDIGYDTGELEPGTTYYWRVDEFYGTDTVKGAVVSFNTVPILPMSDDPNLVAQWTFDGDSGGVVLDHSGNANHGLLRSGAQTVAGRDGEVLDMGVDGYVAISNLVYDVNNAALPEVTVSCWIRTDVETDQYIISYDRDENFRFEISGYGGGPGQVGWDVMTLQDGAESMVDYGSVTRVDDGEWHHIAGIFDNGTLTIYIDGFAEPSATGGPVYGTGAIRDGSNDSPRYGFIGANSEARSFESSSSGGPPLAGEMDDLRIYNRAFSEDEMRQLYGNLLMAWQPQPEMGDVNDVWTMGSLSWTPGDGATEHFVFLGTDPNAVAAADFLDTTGIYRGYQSEATYIIPETLDFETTYYWRVDERALSGVTVVLTKGRVWTFSTEDDLVIFEEETVVPYDNTAEPFVSAMISLDLDPAQNWAEPIGQLSVSYTGQAAPGSVTVGDVNGIATTTVVGRGAGIAGTADEFQYAYTTLVMNGSMTVKVESLASTDDWTKAGIMIRETLDPSSAFAAIYATGANGVRFEARPVAGTDQTNDSSVATAEEQALTAPVWIKIERTFPFVYAYYSTDGVTFTPMAWNPQVIPMSPAPIYIGLVVTSHSGAETYAEAVFSEITSDGGVMPGPLTSLEIGGMAANSAEPMYLVLEDASGASAAVMNPDPAATQQASATEFIVDLADFAVDLSALTKMTLAVGDLDAPAPGGTGTLTIHNIRLLGMPPLLEEDFDSLAVGSNMHDVDGWEGWWGDAQWGASVTDAVAYSGTNSLEIVGTRDDLVPNWPVLNSGVYVLTVMQYVPATTTAGQMFFGPLSSYGASWDEMGWLGTILTNCETGKVYVDELDADTRVEEDLVRDQWVELKTEMDFDNNVCSFYYGDVLLGTRECPSSQGVDMWPGDGIAAVYYDDFRFDVAK